MGEREGRQHLGVALAAALLALSAASCGRPAAGPPGGGRAEDSPWRPHLRQVEEALAAQDIRNAELAWHTAYASAVRARHWEGLFDVGDAMLRIGEIGGHRGPAEARARALYLSAFFRARHQESAAGLMRGARAFAVLGDQEVAEQLFRVARTASAAATDEHDRASLGSLAR